MHFAVYIHGETFWLFVRYLLQDEELADFHALCESNSGNIASFASSAVQAQHPTSLLQARTLQLGTAGGHFLTTGKLDVLTN